MYFPKANDLKEKLKKAPPWGGAVKPKADKLFGLTEEVEPLSYQKANDLKDKL